MYTRPEAHAAFMKEMFYAVPNKNAVALLDPEFSSTLVTASDNLWKVVKMDADWLATNTATIEPWTTWIGG